jgi:hypothetical protein
MSSRENAHRLTGKELVQQDLMLTRPRRPLAFYMPYLDVDLTDTPAPCPLCGRAAVVPIIYGLLVLPPSEAAACEHWVWGGRCVAGPASAAWQCRACHTRGGRSA